MRYAYWYLSTCVAAHERCVISHHDIIGSVIVNFIIVIIIIIINDIIIDIIAYRSSRADLDGASLLLGSVIQREKQLPIQLLQQLLKRNAHPTCSDTS